MRREKTRYPGVYKYVMKRKVNGKPSVSFYISLKDRDIMIGRSEWGMTAEKAFKEKMRYDAQARGLGHNLRYTLMEVFDVYDKVKMPNLKSQSNYYYWSCFKDRFGHLPLDGIMPTEIQEYYQGLINKGYSPKTAKTIVNFIGTLYRFAIKQRLYQGEIPTTPLQTPPMPDNQRDRFFTKDEVVTILDQLRSLNMRDYMFSLLSVTTGMRFGEIAGLRFKDINWDEKTFYLGTTKNGHSRLVSVPEDTMREFAEFILTIPDREKDDLVFKTSTGMKLYCVPNAIARVIDKVANSDLIQEEQEARLIKDKIKAQKAKQEIRRRKAVFHTFRHTLASWVVQSGGSLYDVQTLLGHRDVQMSARYAKFSPEHKQETLRRATAGVLG